MKNISDQLCSGCGGCVGVCPAGCIQMERDREGFYRAVVKEAACLHCGLCLKHCSLKQKQPERSPLGAYAVYNRDEETRQASSSGGVFTALATAVLEQSGVVFGASFDEGMYLRHRPVESVKELEALRGSKYLQSDISGVYLQVKSFLQTGRPVLFVGTPCQVAGLYTALGDRYDNLLTCDLVCHGAPSAGLFEGYLAYLSGKYRGQVTSWNFRSKEHANARMSYTVKMGLRRGEERAYRYFSGDEEPYTMRFISGALQAKCCYTCPYTTTSRVGDVTLADYWGYEEVHPELSQIRGVSLVLVNTLAGEKALAQAKNLQTVPTVPEKYLKRNHHLSVPGKEHPQRDEIYRSFAETGFTNAFYKKHFLPDGYGMYILKRRIRGILKGR